MNDHDRFVSDSALPVILTRPDTNDLVHIRLFMLDTLTISAGRWNTQNVQSPYWRFYMNFHEGAYIMLESGEMLQFEARQIYFVPSGVRFSCGCDATFRHFCIHFEVIGLSRLTMRALFGGPVALPEDISFSAQVAAFAAEVERAEDRDIAMQCRAKSLIYEGIARYLTALPRSTRDRVQRESLDREALAPALMHIEEQPANSLTVPQMAALCCLSPDHFARRFKAVIGQAPNEYLREQRVMRAAQMLLFSTKTLDEIADLCGFGSRHYLTRVFAQVMGVPPAAYRRGSDAGRPIYKEM